MLYRLTLVLAWLAFATAARADIMWGANGHPITSYPGIPVAQQLDLLNDLGMKSYRVNISFAHEAPKLASIIKEAKIRGIEILPVITPGGIDLEKDTPEQLYKKAYTLATKLGSEFKNDVRIWELGNEMENFAIIKPCEKRDDGSQYPCEWGPAGGVDAVDYYGPRWAKVSAVLKGLSDAMIAVDPEIRKAMGTAGWGHVGAFERMKKDGIAWDISVWHMYGEDPEWAFKTIAGYGKPIWVTELNNPYGSQHGEQKQSEGLQKTMARLRVLRQDYKVEAAHIYELLDETYWAPDFEAYMGLVRLVRKPEGGWMTGEPKPAYFTVKELISNPPRQLVEKRDCDLAASKAIKSSYLRQADYAYCLVLRRKGQPEALAQLARALEEGTLSFPGAVVNLIRSPEFDELYASTSLTDRDYVAFIFGLLLHRNPDGQGLESYTQQLASGAMTRESVAYGIATSSEFLEKHSSALPEVDSTRPRGRAG